MHIFNRNLKDVGMKILIIASVLLIVVKFLFEWNQTHNVWVEGTSILIVAMIVTMISSFTEYRLNNTITRLKQAQQNLIKVSIFMGMQV